MCFQVQTREQYVLVHKVVGALFEQQLKLLDSHIYQNIDTIQKNKCGSPGRLERSKSMGSLEGRIVGKATVIRRAQPNQIAGRVFSATVIPKGENNNLDEEQLMKTRRTSSGTLWTQV